MTDKELENQIFERISYETGVPIDVLTLNTDFEKELDIFTLIELVMHAEEVGIIKTEFDDDEALEKVKTIGDFIDLVKVIRNRETNTTLE